MLKEDVLVRRRLQLGFCVLHLFGQQSICLYTMVSCAQSETSRYDLWEKLAKSLKISSPARYEIEERVVHPAVYPVEVKLPRIDVFFVFSRLLLVY